MRLNTVLFTGSLIFTTFNGITASKAQDMGNAAKPAPPQSTTAPAQQCVAMEPGTLYYCHNHRKKDTSACARYNAQFCGARFTDCAWIKAGSWTGYMCVSEAGKPPLPPQ